MGVLNRALLFVYSLIVGLWALLVAVFFGELIGLFFRNRSLFPLTISVGGNVWIFILWFGFSLIVFILSLRFLWMSIKQDFSTDKGIDQETEVGAVHISLTTIEEIVVRASKQVKGVFNLKARVYYDKEKSHLNIGLKIEIDGKRSIQSLSEELQRTVKKQVEEIAGVEVNQVSVYVSQTNTSNQNRLRVS